MKNVDSEKVNDDLKSIQLCDKVLKKMDVCSICLEDNAPRSCDTCTLHIHVKCKRNLLRKNPTWKRKCIICKTERNSPVKRVTRSMTQKYQSDTVTGLISRFETTENAHEKRELLEEIFNTFYQHPILMRIPGVKSMVRQRLTSLYIHWPRASHHFRLLLGKELQT